MMETLFSQARAEVAMPRRSREGRRESKVAYRTYSSYAARNVPVYQSSPENKFSGQNGQLHLQTPGQLQTHDLMTGYFDVHRFSTGNSNPSPVIHQNIQDDSSWLSLSPTYNTFPSNQPSSPQTSGGNDGYSPRSETLQLSDNSQPTSYNAATPRTGQGGSETGDMSFLDLGSSSIGSWNSMLLSGGNSATSPFSDGGYVYAPFESAFDSSIPANQIQDLALSGEFYQPGPTFDPSSSPLNPLFSPEFSFGNSEWYAQACESDGFPSSESNPMAHTVQSPRTLSGDFIMPNDPWDPQNIGNHQPNADPGVVAFEPTRDDAHLARPVYLDTGQSNAAFFDLQQPASPTGESDSDSWRVVPYANSNSELSLGSPEPGVSPPAYPSSPHQSLVVDSRSGLSEAQSHSPSPPRNEIDHPHSHTFTTMSRVSKPKPPRGRQRGLTDREKKEARDVREAKACWACHISKTKCSPCSYGKPCEQCARLAGKRRFCLFSCFNDPLETLFTFLVPDYLMGHFTKANVEQFVAANASSWGTQYFLIRMDWGYRKLLTAEVVALALRTNSEMGYQNQIIHEGTRPALVRKQSPPLGIPLAAVDDMQDTYSRYIQDIVQSDLAEYVSTAYPDQETQFAERLLGAIGTFYDAGHQMDNESDLLRRALEMHVTAVILERSLVLDNDSLHQVEDHLQQQYPEQSAPRCAQRQIKLAFFLLQQRRILKVLKDWGNMMWATNPNTSKDKEWALAFSVFVVLILVMDKTLGAAYYFCEGQIKHHGRQAGPERAEFQKLVGLTEKELFERCKEIFHWKFKTRKGGKEACNPIRDGAEAFQGKSKSIDPDVSKFVRDLQNVVGDFEHDIRASRQNTDPEHVDAGRLASIFVDDFLVR